MKLYHFTQPAKLASIAYRGLLPAAGKAKIMTRGRPVVWLTTDADDIAWIRSYRTRPHRLTVRLEPNDKRLAHYATWLGEQRGSFVVKDGGAGAYKDLLQYLKAPQQTHWYVYFGTIPPNKIEGLA